MIRQFIMGVGVGLLWFVGLLPAQTWTPQNSNTTVQLRGLFMINEQEGWACGDAGVVLHTADGGQNWSMVVLTAADLHEVTFKDAQTGIIVGDGGTILRTTDGGATWNFMNSATTSQLRGADWGEGDVVWAAGRDGAVVRSMDAGATWMALNSGTTERLRAISAVGTDHAWVVGNNGVIRHTADGGMTWTTQTSVATGNLQDVQFLSTAVGFACGSGSLVLYTNDGGNTWVSRSAGIAVGQNGLYFLDENTGWSVGGGGTIYATTDAGMTWIFQASGVAEDLNEVFFPSSQKGWIVGNNGRILHFQAPTGVEPSQTLPTSPRLEQNYPNPFNPSTTVRFHLPAAEQVTLTVYSITGQPIATLIAGKRLAPGTHEVVFEAAHLASGVYFYELTAGNTRQIRRMILLR